MSRLLIGGGRREVHMTSRTFNVMLTAAQRRFLIELLADAAMNADSARVAGRCLVILAKLRTAEPD
jgi:hypothetical protein